MNVQEHIINRLIKYIDNYKLSQQKLSDDYYSIYECCECKKYIIIETNNIQLLQENRYRRCGNYNWSNEYDCDYILCSKCDNIDRWYIMGQNATGHYQSDFDYLCRKKCYNTNNK